MDSNTPAMPLVNCRRRRVLKLASIAGLVGLLFYVLLARPTDQTRSAEASPKDLTDAQGYIGRDRVPASDAGHTGTSDGERMIAEYCNSPFRPMTGAEGEIPLGYKLRQVHVFIRHGDRTSIHGIHGYKQQVYNCNFSSWYPGTMDHIKQFAPAMETMTGKQPVKSYFRDWSLFPNRKTCGGAMLTSRGALQHIRNGHHFQSAYMERNQFIDKARPYENQLVVRSTMFSRTYQSAVALLYGFLPNFNITHVDIVKSESLHFCSEKSTYMKSCYCQNGQHLAAVVKQFTKERQSSSINGLKLRKRLSDIFSSHIDQIPWLSAVIDTFIPSFCHNLSIPCSDIDPKSCVNSSLLGDIWKEVIELDRLQKYDVTSAQVEHASIMLYPVMVEIAQRFRDLMEKRFTPRFVLYSGHDVTLAPLLTLLGLYDVAWPPYASRIVIETLEAIQQDPTYNVKYYFRLIYNGVDRTSDVLFCKPEIENGLCPLQLFTKFVFGEMLQRYKYKSYSEACAGQ